MNHGQQVQWLRFGWAVLMLAAGVTGASVQAGVRLSVEWSAWDFGNVESGEILTHEFIIRNEGDQDYRPLRIVPECGACTVAAMSPPLIPPGSEGRLRCVVDLAQIEGNFFRQVSIFSREEESAPVVFSLKATVRQSYRISPPKVNLSTLEPSGLALVEVQKVASSPGEWSEIVATDGVVTAEIVEGHANRWLIGIRAAKNAPFGKHPFVVALRGSSSNQPPCRVYGTLYNPPDLEILPESLRFEPVVERQKRLFWIRQQRGSALELVDVKPSRELVVTVMPSPWRRDYRVEITAENMNQALAEERVVLMFQDEAGNKSTQTVPIFAGLGRLKEGNPTP